MTVKGLRAATFHPPWLGNFFFRGIHEAQMSASSTLFSVNSIVKSVISCPHNSLMLIFKKKETSFPLLSVQDYKAPRKALLTPTLFLKSRSDETLQRELPSLQ